MKGAMDTMTPKAEKGRRLLREMKDKYTVCIGYEPEFNLSLGQYDEDGGIERISKFELLNIFKPADTIERWERETR